MEREISWMHQNDVNILQNGSYDDDEFFYKNGYF